MTAKTPLVLLPGLLCDRALWQFQIAALSDRAEILVPDLTGAETIAGLAASVLAEAPERFALAGLSMGGYVAFELLRQAPDRVTRVAFLDTSARPDSADQARRRKGLIALSRTGSFKGVTPRLLPQLLHPDHVETPIAQIVMDMAQRIGRDGFIRQENAILGRPDSRPDLAAIDVPALVLVGEADVLTPPDLVREIADGIPGARFRMIDKAGHLPPLEQPEAITGALAEWLAR
jgi:pimeloyl-ACP methyl ester carboxylesterase